VGNEKFSIPKQHFSDPDGKKASFARQRGKHGTEVRTHPPVNERKQNCGLINSVPLSSIFLGSFCRWLPNINKETDKKITMERYSFIHSLTQSLNQYLNTYYAQRGACADPTQSQGR